MVILKKVTVNNFKSIIETNEVEFKDNLTAIVGKTGTGKTSFLKIISSLNKEYEYKDSELPNGSAMKKDYTNGKIKPESILMVKLTFEFDSDQPQTISDVIGETNDLTVSRFLNGHYEVETKDKSMKEGTQDYMMIMKQFQDAVSSVKNDVERAQQRMPQMQNLKPNIYNYLENFLKSDFRNPNEIELSIQTLQNNLNSLPKDQQFQNEINQRLSSLRTSKEGIVRAISNDPVIKIVQELPSFIYLSDPFQLEESVLVDDFIKGPSNSMTFYYASVLGGLTPSGVQKVRTQQFQERTSYFDTISKELTKKVNEYLNLGYTFKIVLRDGELTGSSLVLMVEDEKTGSTISVSEMSEGQKWWVAFYLYLSYLGSLGDKSKILLLDNPATALHDEGKGEVLHFLQRMTETEKLQIIYATHERALIDPWRLDRVLLVTKDNKGTFIKSMQQERRGDLLESIRRHIGSPAKYSLFGAPYNVFFEGISDLNYISALNELLERKNKEHFDKDVYSINAINGIDESVHFNSLLKSLNLEFIIVVDSDSNKINDIKRKIGEEDFNKHFIEIKQIIKREGDIEDLINKITYFELFTFAYQSILKELPNKEVLTTESRDKKMINRYKDISDEKGFDFDKTLVSYQAFKLINDESKFSTEPLEETLKNFSNLFSLVKRKFSS